VAGVRDTVALAQDLVIHHKVAVAPGSAFGESGEGWLRVCFAIKPDRLSRAVGRLAQGLAALAPAERAA
jgi:aspartate aminotransferase